MKGRLVTYQLSLKNGILLTHSLTTIYPYETKLVTYPAIVSEVIQDMLGVVQYLPSYFLLTIWVGAMHVCQGRVWKFEANSVHIQD
jgi:hypothetical protein